VSAPSTVLRQASSFRYGVLSVKTAKVLRSALEDRPLTEEDRETLRRAAAFLIDISDGARIATGTIRARARGHTSRSIAALDYALPPIEALHAELGDDIAPHFDRMARALNAAVSNRLTHEHHEVLRHALMFFEALRSSLVRDRRVRRVALGGPHRKAA
jgi:hypothetical protein